VLSLVKYRAGRRAARRAGEAGKRTEYLAFVLANETYAVQIAQLAEILRPPPITEVPRAPRVVLGVISVRGKLVTVVDLRRRLNLVEGPIDRRSRILLVESGGGEQLGLLVDEVQQVWRLAAEEIEPANVLGGDQAVHIAGIGRPTGVVGAEGTVLILLDLRFIVEGS
jgi:purine-binding chemotaxis protein CheW